MKKSYGIIGVIVLAIILVGVFTGSHRSDQITIGALLPLTGKSASIGERVKLGIETAKAELKREKGVDLNIIIEDDKGEAPIAVSAAQKLINTDHVNLIIGTLKSDPMLAVAPITEKNKVILLSPTAGAEGITNAGDYVFRNIESPDIHGQASANYFVTKNQIKQAALFAAKASNAQSYVKFFELRFKEAGGTITYKTDYNPEDNDFRTDITKAIKSGAQAFYLGISTARDAGILARQIREAGFKGIIMVSVAADAKEFFETAGAASEGVVITTSYFSADSVAGSKFNSAYKELSGMNGDGWSANGYDAVMLLYRATESCGDTTKTDCIRDFLYNTKSYEGAGGTLSFDKNGDVVKPVTIKIGRGGQFLAE